MIPIPNQQTKQWSVSHASDLFGNLVETKNLDFDKEGYLRLASRSNCVYSVSTTGNTFDDVLAILHIRAGTIGTGGGGWYIVTSDEVYYATSLESTPTALSSSKNPGSGGDGVVFNGKLYVSTDANVYSYTTGGGWSANLLSTTSGVAHPLCVFEAGVKIAVGDGNVVKLLDTTNTVTNTLTIPAEYEVRWIRYRQSSLYIGTRNKTGGQAKMFVWNGSSTDAQQGYGVGSDWAFSGEEYNNSIHVLNSIGQLLRFNGGGFDPVQGGSLPVYYSKTNWYTGTGFVNGRVAQRGMAADGDILYVNITADTSEPPFFNRSMQGGVWVYDPKVGFYHKASPTLSKTQVRTVSSSAINTTTNIIDFGETINAQTGDKVFYSSTTNIIGGLKDGNEYFIGNISGTTFQLSTTYANAIAGTYIDLTSVTGASSCVFRIASTKDYGSGYGTSQRSGAIAVIPSSASENTVSAQSIVFGFGQVNDATNATFYTLQTLGYGKNVGYAVVTKINSPQVTSAPLKLYIKYSGIEQSDDKIVVKVKNKKKNNLPIKDRSGDKGYVANWTGTTTFTSTGDLSDVSVGDEITIIGQAGAGTMTHVSSISESSGTYTVTVTEAPIGVANSRTSYIIINNFVKLGEVTTSSETHDKGYAELPLGDEYKSKWTQFKYELRGEEVTIEETQVVDETHKPSR